MCFWIGKILRTQNTIYWYFQFTKIRKFPNPHNFFVGNIPNPYFFSGGKLTRRLRRNPQKKVCVSQRGLRENKSHFTEQFPEDLPFDAIFHATSHLAAFHSIHVAQDFGGGVDGILCAGTNGALFLRCCRHTAAPMSSVKSIIWQVRLSKELCWELFCTSHLVWSSCSCWFLKQLLVFA